MCPPCSRQSRHRNAEGPSPTLTSTSLRSSPLLQLSQWEGFIANLIIVLMLAGGKAFDESSLTGESLPGARREGEPILSGSVNGNSSAIIVATALA